MNKLVNGVIILLLGISCSGIFTKDVRAFIEGSYVRDFENEFAVGVDSVVLQKEGENNYLILKYSRFARIKNGSLLPDEVKQEKMMGVYDEKKKVINELQKGKVLSFNVKENKMFIGASEYQKIN
jgi:hypothetical protein